jgi:FxsC-like protein
MTRVGVTGHTALTSATQVLVYRCLLACLADHAEDGLWGVTCLAEGADQLFARAVLAANGQFEALIPAEDYRERIVRPDNWPVFDQLVGAASSVSYMPFRRAGRPAYAAASAEMLRRCDLLVAVWDGEQSRHVGDTADVVARARRLGIPVIVCWPDGAARERSDRRVARTKFASAIALRPHQCTVRDAAVGRVRGPSEERVLYFFLSYARGDDDAYVERFYHDLCAEVRVRTGLGREVEVGFFDNHSIAPGAAWSERVIDALSQCRAFLALCSPAYFLSETCGKEWTVFADRLQRYRESTGVQPPALIPLVWFPPRSMPPVAEALQYRADVLGDAYNRDGLRQLIRLQRNRDLYLEFVSAVAESIVATAYAHDVPRPSQQADLNRVPSVFHNHSPVTLSAGVAHRITADLTAPAGSHFVHFVVVSASRDEIARLRGNVQLYGAHPHDWAPYGPSRPTSLGDIACRVAAERSFQSGLADAEDLAALIDRANESNHIVVLLVDAWAVGLERHGNALKAYDQRMEPTTAVMVPCSLEDEETQQHWGHLSQSLRTVFLNHTVGRDDVMFRSSVLTPDTFEADLQVVLEVAKNRVFARGTVFRRPAGGSATDRPILNGP